MDVIDNPLTGGTEDNTHDEQVWVMEVIQVAVASKCLSADIEESARESMNSPPTPAQSPQPNSINYVVEIVVANYDNLVARAS